MLGFFAARGSRAAWVVLVTLNGLVVASAALLALPVDAQLLLFYALALLALLALLTLLAVPVLEARARRVIAG